ncbi:Cytochrome b-c1 complex subunit 8 [Penicillium robsamsonii]|uniref:Cytochrome b-c1 complex subunit 8 n=1 Tax=Penicillium robsamsonii TaxID=1792511 RepID=UPI002547145E|nr:Cytochrome b-c1 complex subunit 8 [Penicillium robsamsonii]KAJ5826784.1 Cytochrome b-c1 complex subunit 8 [Penicillium robsamsonii]
MGGSVDPKNGHFIGNWGEFGCPTPQRIATYSLSANRQKPFAGAGHAAIFNVFRRFRHQVLYVVPPSLPHTLNEYLNSKPGRLLEGGNEE